MKCTASKQDMRIQSSLATAMTVNILSICIAALAQEVEPGGASSTTVNM